MIFLDFGLSKFVCENNGEKTATRFVGTLKNTSPEMRKTYYLNKAIWVDLYYNDQWRLYNLHNLYEFIKNNGG